MKQSDYIHELIEQGRFTEAKNILSAGTVRAEAIFELAFNLGNGFYSCEQFRDARDSFGLAQMHESIGLLATVKFANCLLKTGDRAAALSILYEVSDNFNALPHEASDIYLRIVVHLREYELLAKAEQKSTVKVPEHILLLVCRWNFSL